MGSIVDNEQLDTQIILSFNGRNRSFQPVDPVVRWNYNGYQRILHSLLRW